MDSFEKGNVFNGIGRAGKDVIEEKARSFLGVRNLLRGMVVLSSEVGLKLDAPTLSYPDRERDYEDEKRKKVELYSLKGYTN